MSPSSRLTATLLMTTMPLAVAAANTRADTDTVDAAALYNQGATVIENSRSRNLIRGPQHITWPLRGRLQPDTLWLAGTGVRLIGFTTPATGQSNRHPLAARIGQPVTLTRAGDGGAAKSRRVTVVDVSANNVFVRSRNRIERITPNSPWQISWAAPAIRGKRANLRLDVAVASAGRHTITATYQIDGPTWQASYTGRFDPKSGRLALQSAAVIDNGGGARLHAQKAWLVAGELARTDNAAPRPMMMAKAESTRLKRTSAPRATGDTYRYPLSGGLDLPAGAVRSVVLMPTESFQAKRRYRFENNVYTTTASGRAHAAIRLSFHNRTDQPLPAGPVRVYNAQRPADFMGTDRIDNIPENASVALTLGQSFDVTSRRKLLADTRTQGGAHRRRFEITVDNASGRRAAVALIEDLPQGAHIVSASRPRAAQAGADTAVWHINIPAHGRSKLRYTVRWPG